VLLLSIEYVLYDLYRFYSQGYLMKPTRSYHLLFQTLHHPLATSRGLIREKKALVLLQVDECEQISFGEISPLPGFKDFNLEQAISEAKIWSEKGGEFQSFSLLGPALSCLQSGIWSSCLPETTLPETAHIWSKEKPEKSGVIKRKIGLLSTREEIPVICKWLDQLGEGVTVRLDPNESFSRDDLKRWIDAIHSYECIQFIEQPTAREDEDWLIEFSHDSPIPLALDEALLRMQSMHIISHLPPHLFLVFKPTFYDDWEGMAQVIQHRKDHVVVSTGFESPFGYEALIRLSAYSSLSPGLDRTCFTDQSQEFSSHHQAALTSPSVPVADLCRLWNKFKR
jgi:O-succinylbenzoate synthase